MNTKIYNMLCKQFPTAKKNMIKIFLQALDLHARKNNDYNGKRAKEFDYELELLSKFLDIRRKYSRLQNIIVEKKETKVDEKLLDTILDLGNYAFLMAEFINRK